MHLVSVIRSSLPFIQRYVGALSVKSEETAFPLKYDVFSQRVKHKSRVRALMLSFAVVDHHTFSVFVLFSSSS